MGFWKALQVRDEARELDIEKARAELVQAKQETREVNARASVVATASSYLAERRELNHFGESLSDSLTPRRRHV